MKTNDHLGNTESNQSMSRVSSLASSITKKSPRQYFLESSIFEREASYYYFLANTSEQKMGPSLLLAKSVFYLQCNKDMIPKNVTKLFLLLYYHVVTIPALSQNIFATILGMFYDLGYFNKNLFQCTFLTHLHPRLPMSLTELQTWFSKGPNSIHQNIPHPLVHNLADHSYVSITECLRHHLAHGISTIPIKKVWWNYCFGYFPVIESTGNIKKNTKTGMAYGRAQKGWDCGSKPRQIYAEKVLRHS